MTSSLSAASNILVPRRVSFDMKSFPSLLVCPCASVFALALAAREGHAINYDPLREDPGSRVVHLELSIHDEVRSRDIPVRVDLPANTAPAPVVLFSHGLGGSRKGSAFLGEHWAARGYVVVFLQHPSSDDQVWKDQPLRKRMGALREAASIENFMLRVQDVHAALDRLQIWNETRTNVLYGRLDLTKIGMRASLPGGMRDSADSRRLVSSLRTPSC